MVPRNSKSNYGSKLSNKNSWPLYLAIVAVCVGGIGYFVEVAHYEVLLLCDITYYLSLDLVTSLMSGGTSPAPIGTISQVDTLYFKTYDFALNDANNWDWASPNSTTIRRACTKKFTNLCILINATTPGFIIEYKHQQYNFLNDNDFTQFDMTYPLQSIIPQPQASIINRRQLSDINNMHMDAAQCTTKSIYTSRKLCFNFRSPYFITNSISILDFIFLVDFMFNLHCDLYF